jgi:adenylate kinase
MNLLLLGPPGVGKGTQAALLAAQTGLTHVASGTLLRRHLRSATRLGLQAQASMERGELVPDALVISMLLEHLGTAACAAGAILDGFPRTLSQAQALATAFERHQRRLNGVIYLTAPNAVLLERIAGRQTCPNCEALYHRFGAPPGQAGICDRCGRALSGRADDTVETAQRRLAVYRQQTQPLVEHYRQRGLLYEIDSSGPVAEVARAILQAVHCCSTPAQRARQSPGAMGVGARA